MTFVRKLGKTNCITYIPEDVKTDFVETVKDWTQPVLTANGTMGGGSFAASQSSILNNDSGSQAWKAFDNQGSTTRWHSAQNLPQWISWYNPKPLKISNIQVTNRSTDGSYPNAYQLQYSDDNSTWTTVKSGNGSSGNSVSWDIPVTYTGFHCYWRIYVTSATGSNSSYVAIGEIKLTAQEKSADIILKAGSKLHVPNGKTEQKYYKYVDREWAQPLNPNGVTSSSGWTNPQNVFDGSADTYATCGTSTDYIEWDLGAEVYLSGITATGNYVGNVARSMGLRIYSVNGNTEKLLGETNKGKDSTTYDLTASFTRTLCSKIRIRLAEKNNNGDAPTATYKTRIREIKLVADTQRVAIESTADDYDFEVGAGTNIFEEVVIKEDFTLIPAASIGTFFQVISTSSTLWNRNCSTVTTFSGDTAPDLSSSSDYATWYDTANNVIKITSDKGVTWNATYKLSLPFCLAPAGVGYYKSVKLFNGFGYIGSTAFALPNVKFLIPDGINTNGTLKNNDVTLPKVVTRTITWNNSGGQQLFIGKYTEASSGYEFISTGNLTTYYEQDTEPTKVNYAMWYKISENKYYRCYLDDAGNLYWKECYTCHIGQWQTEAASPYKMTLLSIKSVGEGISRTKAFKAIKGSIADWKSYINTSTPGTYSITIPEESLARVTCVGGGGAAAMRGQYDDKGYGWSGGSGGAFSGMFQLPAGTYTVVVGSANNNTTAQSGNTQTLNPSDTSTHDSYITGVVRAGGGGSGHYSSNYVGAAGAAPVLEMTPLKTYTNSAGNAGGSGSGGKGSAAAAVINGGASVYQGYGQGQGCATSEYAAKRYWINGTNGYVKIEAVAVKDYEKRSKSYKAVKSATVELIPFPETATLSTTVSLGKVYDKTVKTAKGASIVCTGSADGWDSVTVRKKVAGDSSIDIPLKKTLLESSTAGTYTLNITEAGYLEMQFVGGGGGGTCSSWSSGDGGGADGGSGGYSRYVNIPVAPGSYTVKVGAGGARALTYEWGDVTGGTGGESSITIGDTKYYAGGGTGSRSWGAWNWTVGKGGWGNVSNGNNGQGRSGYNKSGIDTASVYGGYGAGGAGCATNPGGGLTGWCHNGYSGYAKIVFRLAKA